MLGELGEAAELLDLTVVGAVVDHAHDEEQHRADDAVREEVQHGAEMPADVIAAMPGQREAHGRETDGSGR